MPVLKVAMPALAMPNEFPMVMPSLLGGSMEFLIVLTILEDVIKYVLVPGPMSRKMVKII